MRYFFAYVARGSVVSAWVSVKNTRHHATQSSRQLIRVLSLI